MKGGGNYLSNRHPSDPYSDPNYIHNSQLPPRGASTSSLPPRASLPFLSEQHFHQNRERLHLLRTGPLQSQVVGMSERHSGSQRRDDGFPSRSGGNFNYPVSSVDNSRFTPGIPPLRDSENRNTTISGLPRDIRTDLRTTLSLNPPTPSNNKKSQDGPLAMDYDKSKNTKSPKKNENFQEIKKEEIQKTENFEKKNENEIKENEWVFEEKIESEKVEIKTEIENKEEKERKYQRRITKALASLDVHPSLVGSELLGTLKSHKMKLKEEKNAESGEKMEIVKGM